MLEYQHLLHPNAPVWDKQSRVLILGTFPSIRSRETGFFYGHPQNRFWKVLSAVFDSPCPETIQEKEQFLLSRRIALWDVIAECDIAGSADSSIRRVRPNPVQMILDGAEISEIFVNGATAERLYLRYLAPFLGREAIRLPSTSPANASWSAERLYEAWSAVRVAIEQHDKIQDNFYITPCNSEKDSL